MDTYDPYIRVSATKGRADGGLGAAEQRRKVKAWGEMRGVDLEWGEPDLDQSGGKLKRPGLDRIRQRIRDGETDGIVVSKFDRLSRASVKDALEVVEEIVAAGGKVVSVDEGIDPTTPYGEFAMTLLLALARMQRTLLKDQLDHAKSAARADGAHVAPPPVGTHKSNGVRSPIVADPETAPLVRECFKMRAEHASWLDLAKYLRAHGVRISKNGAAYVVRNRTYVEVGIVTDEEWEAAQVEGRKHAKDGTIAAQGLVSGLLTCGGCGHKLNVGRTGPRQEDGKRAASYGCKGHFSGGPCPAPASVRLASVDEFVQHAIGIAIVDGTLKATMDVVTRHRLAVEGRDEAQAALDAIKSNGRLRDAIGEDAYTDQVAELRERLEQAKRRLRKTPVPDEYVPPRKRIGIGWEGPIEDQRREVRQVVEEVALEKSGRGRWGKPIHERVRIRWAGEDDFDATIGQKVGEAKAAMRAA